MTIWWFMLLGALGGSLRTMIDVYGQVIAWHGARKELRLVKGSKRRSRRPALSDYIDVVPEVVAAAVHIVLGAAAGALFGGTGQVTGAYAAVLVGAAAPALLAQVGQVKTVRDAVAGPGLRSERTDEVANVS